MDQKERKEEGRLSIGLSEDIAKGIYSNMALITHSPTEMVIDFVALLPGMPKPPVCSRVIMAPQHAKRLLFALQDNIAKYEKMFGKIEINEGKTYVPPVSEFHGDA